MSVFIAVGRTLLIVIFVFTGVSQLLDIGGTADMISAKLSIPGQIAPYTTQLEEATGTPAMRIFAIAVGALQVVGGLLIAFNIGARWFALLLALFTIPATFLFHDFWNLTDVARIEALNHLLKNVAILGGLLLVVGIGPPAREEDHEPQFDDQ